MNLNAIFPEKFAVTSVINIYSSGNYSYTWIMIVYSINFQIRQIPASNQHFSWEY